MLYIHNKSTEGLASSSEIQKPCLPLFSCTLPHWHYNFIRYFLCFRLEPHHTVIIFASTAKQNLENATEGKPDAFTHILVHCILSSLLMFLSSYFFHFLSGYRASQSHPFTGGLWVTRSLHVSSPESVPPSLSDLKALFSECKNWLAVLVF